MEMQDVCGNETGSMYMNSPKAQDNPYEEVKAQDVRGNESGRMQINSPNASNNTYQENKAQERISLLKTSLTVACLIIVIAFASATIFMFTKVMNNEKAFEKSFSILNILSTNRSETSVEAKVDMKLNEVAVGLNDTNEKTLNKLRGLNEKFDMKLIEIVSLLNDTIGNVISKLESLEEKVGTKLSEVSARLNDTDHWISKLSRQLPVKNCTQTSKNGVNTLTSGGRVYCSNGWTVFQKRMDGSIPDFHNKTWEEYSQGFGNLNGEFWLGLRKLHEITGRGGCRLRVDLQSFDNDRAYAEYSTFSVANEADLFRLTVGGYNGTAGDDLSSYNGMAFSTNERDNDMHPSLNCATHFHSGGWWNKACFDAAPNGIYGETRPGGEATKWHRWKGSAAMKFIQMGVRCD